MEEKKTFTFKAPRSINKDMNLDVTYSLYLEIFHWAIVKTKKRGKKMVIDCVRNEQRLTKNAEFCSLEEQYWKNEEKRQKANISSYNYGVYLQSPGLEKMADKKEAKFVSRNDKIRDRVYEIAKEMQVKPCGFSEAYRNAVYGK
ncbi:MAG: hypothetical protein FWD49_06525 [Firmicutes bacterium]|nr:hypothetical protein [Bacillota bacterium]